MRRTARPGILATHFSFCDSGRSDLRPGNGDVKEAANKLAHQIYHSLRDKLMILEDETIVYLAHGASTLCG